MLLGSDIDYGKLWKDIKSSAGAIITDIPKQVQKTIEDKTVAAVQPTLQVVATKKTERVVSAGNVALLAAIGATAGFLVAGGSYTRKGVGAGVGGLLGGLAGLKIGLLKS